MDMRFRSFALFGRPDEEPHHDEPGGKPGLRWSHSSRRFSALVLVVGLASSTVLALLTNDVVKRSQHTLLLNQAAISAAAIGGAVGQIRSSLDAVVTVAVATGGDTTAIQRVTSLPAMKPYASLLLLSQQEGHWVPAVVARPARASLVDGSSPVGSALQSAPDNGINVLGIVGSGSGRTIAVVDRPVGVPQYAVYLEVPLAIASASASSSASSSSGKTQPLNDLDFALYLHETEQPVDLITATTPHLPLQGTRAVVPLALSGTTAPSAQISARPGDTTAPAGDLLMVFSPKSPLGGALTADLAWIGLIAGIVLTFIAALGARFLLRSRNQALELVKEMRHSNETRDRALAERAEAQRQHERLEGQLRQAQRLEAVGQLAGGIAHDFNNLLAVILNFGQFVLTAVRGHPAEPDVQDMLKAAQQAADLTRQLLVFSRKDVVRPESVDLNAVVDGTVRLLGRTLGEHIELRLHLDPDLPRVEADIGGLEQVLMNLAVNARDAMADGGQLTISTSVAEIDSSYSDTHVGSALGTHVLLEVSDTGCGMSTEVSLRIFEPFFTTKAAGLGTGMGLATVYGIVSRLGGHISVYSEVDLGTAFKIWLPVTTRGALTRPAAAPSVTEDGAGRSILLIEDEPAVRRAARRILESAGYRVVEAANGSEAVAAFEKETPDVVVSDVVMPGGMSGKALADQFHAVAPEVPVLFMSGYTADIITARGVLDDNVMLIQKPFSAEILLEGISRALRGASARLVLERVPGSES